ncbi:MAG: hypothetical protein ACYSX0_17405 [Planctomycetota bacterium]|jgi:hypothetical protein
MGKKKDCFGQEDYVCMTPSCPYVKDCIKIVWAQRLERIVSRKNRPPVRKRSRSRLTVDG